MSNKKLDWAEYREDGDWVNLNIEKNKSPMEEIVLFDDSKNNELVVVDETLYLLEKKKNDSDIKQKEPLYKRILKKFIRPVAVTGLVASSLFCLSGEEKEMPVLDQRQPDLEQLVDYEKERLQRPVRVKRSLKVGKAKLCKSVEGKCKEIKEIVKGEEGNFYVSIDLDLEGLRNKKLVKETEIKITGLEGRTSDSDKDEISFPKNGKNNFIMPFHSNSLGTYKMAVEFKYSGLSDDVDFEYNVVGCDTDKGYCVADVHSSKGYEKIKLSQEILGVDTTTTCISNSVEITPLSNDKRISNKVDLEPCYWRGPCDCNNIKREIKKISENMYRVSLNFWSDNVGEEWRKHCNFTYIIRSDNGVLTKVRIE